MQRIRYAGVDYLADEGMAEAVLRYAKALAERREVDVVKLRVGRPDGSIGRAGLLIGDGIPIAIDSLPDGGPWMDGELEEPDAEHLVRQRTDGLTRAPAFRVTSASHVGQFVDG